MKIRLLIITAIVICTALSAIFIIPNPVLTALIYPYEHGEIPEVRAFYDKFGHSVDTATGDDNIIALINQDNHVFTTLIVLKDTNSNNYGNNANSNNNYDSRVTCAKGKDVHTITKDVITFLKEYDCFGSKPYPHSPADLHKIP